MRYLLLLLTSLSLLACNEVSRSIGEGPKIVSERFAGQVANLDKDLRFRNISIAVGRNSSRASMHYCPALGDCVNDLDGSVVDRCNDGGKHDCALFMQDDKIVWRGPILMLNKSTSQAIPYSGRWRLGYEWANVGKGETELVARFGKMQTGEIVGRGTCRFAVQPTSLSRGNFRLFCSEARLTASGSYVLTEDRIAIGSGKDNKNGNNVILRWAMDAGTAL